MLSRPKVNLPEMNALTLSFSLVFVVSAAGSSFAAEWRGIVPVHSTRTDVVRSFNECHEKKEHCSFTLEDQKVSVVFSGWQRAFSGCQNNVPADTVLLVSVSVNRPIERRDLKVNLKKFKSFNPGGRDYRGYIDENAGLLVQSHNGKVLEFVYIASREDKSYCPRYYENPGDFIQVVEGGGHMWPAIVASCPQSPRAGSTVTFVLVSADDDYDSISWTLTEGTIVSGQGTREITVDTTGLAGRKIKATVDVTYNTLPVDASCEVEILPALAKRRVSLDKSSSWNNMRCHPTLPRAGTNPSPKVIHDRLMRMPFITEM